jgi:hypothetical protein
MKKYSILVIVILFILQANAQKYKPTSTNDFVIECMKTNGEGDHKQMVLWFPTAFWEIVAQQMKVSPEFMEQVVHEMDGYMMFAVVDYSSIPGTSLTFKSEDEIRKSIKFIDSTKTIYLPLKDEDISPAAKQLIASLKPIMGQMLGQFGSGMRIFLFNAKKVNGKNPFDILTANSFRLNWDQTSLKWTLPFASVLEPKYCPVDKEQMKGNWNYCPVHGVKLN